MAGIGVSLSRLRKLRDLFENRIKAASAKSAWRTDTRSTRLREIASFGSNPGNLRMYAYVPDGVGRSAPLVVALHGCTQTAASYDQGTGWSHLADRLGFILVFPEQQAANNPKNCFTWFLPGDTTRDMGEALSIRQMIAQAVETFSVDRSRVFVTGLSAGGAMASVMLATYPELFAGGAIIAGLPYGSASSVQEAFEAMFNDRAPSSRALGDHVRGASSHRGPWPKISVWHGTADAVVRPSNGDQIIRQWLDLQKLSERASSEEQIGRHTRRVWRDANGDTQLEAYSLAGIGHGVPLATDGAEGIGMAGQFFLEASLSSTSQIAQFWGLDGAEVRQRQSPSQAAKTQLPAAAKLPALPARDKAPPDMPLNDDDGPRDRQPAFDPNTVIAAAFKAAGLPAAEKAGPARARMIEPGGIIAAALKAAGLTRS